MEQFLEQYRMYIPYLGGFLVLYIIGMIVTSKMRKKGQNKMQQDYFSRYPDSAKVYLTSRAAITSEAVQVLSVDSEYPAVFNEGTKNGFYVKPGTSVIEVNYTYTRPGVMYKNVTKTTGNVQQQIEVEPYKTYHLGFDRKEEQFTFAEVSPAELGA